MSLLGAARAVVMASLSLAIAAGLWPLAGRPGLCATLAAAFALAFAAARWSTPFAAAVLFAGAYTHYGLARLFGGVEIAGMPFWLAGFAGLAMGGAAWTRWQSPTPWRWALAWWSTGVAVTWPVFAARDLGYSLAPSLAAGPIVAAAALQLSLALWMDRWLDAPAGEAATAARDPLARPAWALAFGLSATATAGAALYQRFVDLTWLSGEPWIYMQRGVGLMGDANPTAVATGLWAPLLWVLAAGHGAIGGVIGGLLAGLLWTAGWVSGARTTLILVLAGLAAVLLAAARARRISRRTVVGAAAAAGVLVGMAAVALVPATGASSPVSRLVESVGGRSASGAAYELLWRRDGYGLAAIEAIKEHPLFGVGVGRFHALSTGYHQRLTGRAIPPDNAQNFWRQTLVEQGLVGLAPIVWLTVLTIGVVVSRAASGWGVAVRVMIAALGVALVFGYPLQEPAIAVTLGTLVMAAQRDRLAALAPGGRPTPSP